MANGKTAFRAAAGEDGVAIWISGNSYSVDQIREKDLVLYKANTQTSTWFVPSQWDAIGLNSTGDLYAIQVSDGNEGFLSETGFSWNTVTNTFTAGSGNTNTSTEHHNFILGYDNSLSSGNTIFLIGKNNQTPTGVLNIGVAIGGYNELIGSHTAPVSIGFKNRSSCSFATSLGFNAHASGRASFVHGDDKCSLNNSVVSDKVLASGRHAINMSANDTGQILGYGALANWSAIIGGYNHNIASGNMGAAIIGGNNIDLSGTSYGDHTAVSNLVIWTPPTIGDSADEILVWDSTDKIVKQIPQYFAANGLTYNSSDGGITLGGALTGHTTIETGDAWGITFGYSSDATGVNSFSAGAYTSAFGNESSAFGNDTHASGCATFSMGQLTCASGLGSFAGGVGLYGSYGSSCRTRAGGSPSFNFSENTASQTGGHGALANRSAILGGKDHNIAVGNTGAVILGGIAIKLTGTSYIDYTAVDKLAIWNIQSQGDNADEILVWDSTTKKIKKVLQTTVGFVDSIRTSATTYSLVPDTVDWRIERDYIYTGDSLNRQSFLQMEGDPSSEPRAYFGISADTSISHIFEANDASISMVQDNGGTTRSIVIGSNIDVTNNTLVSRIDDTDIIFYNTGGTKVLNIARSGGAVSGSSSITTTSGFRGDYLFHPTFANTGIQFQSAGDIRFQHNGTYNYSLGSTAFYPAIAGSFNLGTTTSINTAWNDLYIKGGIKAPQPNNSTFTLDAYDVDASGYTTFATLKSANEPTWKFNQNIIFESGLTVTNGNVLLPNGIASAPAISFNTASNSGMFTPGSSILAWSISGVDILRLSQATLYPTPPSTVNLGGGGNRWKDIYFNPTTGASTSDNILTLGTNGAIQYRDASTLGGGTGGTSYLSGLTDTLTTGAVDGSMLYYSGGTWYDTAGALLYNNNGILLGNRYSFVGNSDTYITDNGNEIQLYAGNSPVVYFSNVSSGPYIELSGVADKGATFLVNYGSNTDIAAFYLRTTTTLDAATGSQKFLELGSSVSETGVDISTQTGDAGFDLLYSNLLISGRTATGETNFIRFQTGSTDVFKIDTSGNLIPNGNLILSGTTTGATDSDFILTRNPTTGVVEYRTAESLAGEHNHDSLYWKTTGTTNVTNPIISGNTTIIGNITGTSFVTSGGTSADFVKGDGTLDSSTYDNYGNWIASGDTGSDTITTGQNLYFSGGTGIITSIIGESVRIKTSNIPNSSLANSTISGIALGNNLNNLTIGNGLSGTSSTYNGSVEVTIVHDDTSTLDGALGSTGISAIGVDSYGHITGVSTTTYDNYQYWTISADTGTENISATNPIFFSGGTDISTIYDPATNRLRIDFTGATDTNTFLTGATFNTGDGLLTLTLNDDSAPTVNLDGRYSLTGHSHTSEYDSLYWKTTGTTNVTNPIISGNTTFDGNLNISGGTTIFNDLTLSGTTTSGSSDQVLIRNTVTGVVEYVSKASLGGSGSAPAGSQYQLQYNDGAGGFATDVALYFDGTGTNSLGIGTSTTTATGASSIAIGNSTLADGASSISMGQNTGGGTGTKGIGAIAIGYQVGLNEDIGVCSVAIGHSADAIGGCSVVLGRLAQATGATSVAISTSATAYGAASISIGQNSLTIGSSSIAIGNGACSNGNSGIAMGIGSEADSLDMISIGNSVGAGTGTKNIGAIGIGYQVGINADMGTCSVGIGYSADAIGNCSIAHGFLAQATGTSAIAIGKSSSSGVVAVAIGCSALATGQGGVALGWNSQAKACGYVSLGQEAGSATGTQGSSAISIGICANSTIGANIGQDSVAIGFNAQSPSTGAFALGQGAGNTTGTTGTYAVSIGYASNFSLTGRNIGQDSVAVGHVAVSAGDRSIAMGFTAQATGASSIAIGGNAKAVATDGIAIGDLSCAIGIDTISIGCCACAVTTGAITIGKNAKSANVADVVIGCGAVSVAFTEGVAIGKAASVNNNYGIAIGCNAYAGNSGIIAIGANVGQNGAGAAGIEGVSIGRESNSVDGEAIGCYSVLVGYASTTKGDCSIALGVFASGSSVSGVAIGFRAKVTGDYSVLFGQGVGANNQTLTGASTFAYRPNSIGVFEIASQNDSYIATNNLQLFSSGGTNPYGSSQAGVGMLRLDDATTEPIGTLGSGGLVFVSGTSLYFHGDGGVTTNITTGGGIEPPAPTGLTDGSGVTFNFQSKYFDLKRLDTTETGVTVSFSNIVEGANQILSVKKNIAGTVTITLDTAGGLTFYGYNNADYNTTPDIVLSGANGDIFDISFIARTATEIGVAVGINGN